MKQVVLLLSLIVVLTNPGPASAQRWFGGYGGYGYGGGGYGAQTPFSAAEHGMADIVRSEGVYNVLTSRAMVNYEEARGKYIENADKWLDLSQKKKRIQSAEREKKKEEGRISLARHAEYKLAHPDRPPRLNNTELNPDTGEIKWPSALKRDCFASLRKDMELLFVSSSLGGATSELNMEIYKKTREIQDELRKHIKEMVVREFIAARRFLESLATEGTIPRG